MSNLTILNTSIRQSDSLYSLNDLHQASGGDKNHQPAFFMRNEQTKGLIQEIENDRSANSQIAYKTVRGGRNPDLQGTWVCEELVLAYATWISPKFHLIVLRAFLAMHKGEVQNSQPNLPLVEEQKHTLILTDSELRKLCGLWKISTLMQQMFGLLIKPLNALGSRYAGSVSIYSKEYNFTIEQCRQILVRETNHIDTALLSEEWHKVIHELRKGKTDFTY